MSVTADQISTAALIDLGVVAPTETPGATQLTFCYNVLNRLINTWQTMSLIAPAVQRSVWPIVANKATYTIGPGGDFNTIRPINLQGAGLLLNGFGSPASCTIASTGVVATVTQTAHGKSVGDECVILGANETGYDGIQTVETVPTANTYTYALDAMVASPATGTIVSYTVTNSGVEIPRALLTDDAYEAIQIKRLSNSLFTSVYYNPTASPFAQIVLWPIPNTASNQLVLYINQMFDGFADQATTSYTWPLTPGYQEAIQYALEKRLLTAFSIAPSTIPIVLERAATSLMLIKRSNYKLTDLPTDPALTRSFGAGYNINTGTGAGATS